MSFRPIEQRVTAQTRLPASIRLTPRGETAQPSCVISLRGFFADQVKWKAAEELAVHLGEGDDSGKLRLVRGEKPSIATVRVMKKGGMVFDLGHVAALNDGQSSDKHAIEARVVDKNTIEFTLPDWDDAADMPARTPLRAAVASPAPPASRPAAPASPPPPKKNSKGEPPVTHHGVTIDFAPGAEAIVHRGKLTDVTARGAQLIALLARVMPEPVGRDFIKQKLGLAGDMANLTLDTLAMDLGKALPTIGLTLHTVKGIGFGLKVKA